VTGATEALYVLASGGGSVLAGCVAFVVAKRDAIRQHEQRVSENRAREVRERNRLVAQVNRELVKLYMVELHIRKVLFELSTAADVNGWDGFKQVMGRVGDDIGPPGEPPLVVIVDFE
jgi:hypothetical protein